MRTIKLLSLSAIIILAFCFGRTLGGDKHPMMAAAKKNLEQAKANLQKGQHDFGGHRVKAIALVDQAMKEIEEGILVADNDKK